MWGIQFPKNEEIYFFNTLQPYESGKSKIHFSFKHISLDIFGPIYIRSGNDSRIKIWILFIVDVVFFTVDYYILDNITADAVKIALKMLETKYGEII